MTLGDYLPVLWMVFYVEILMLLHFPDSLYVLESFDLSQGAQG